jgi:hypothetical protein
MIIDWAQTDYHQDPQYIRGAIGNYAVERTPAGIVVFDEVDSRTTKGMVTGIDSRTTAGLILSFFVGVMFYTLITMKKLISTTMNNKTYISTVQNVKEYIRTIITSREEE